MVFSEQKWLSFPIEENKRHEIQCQKIEMVVRSQASVSLTPDTSLTSMIFLLLSFFTFLTPSFKAPHTLSLSLSSYVTSWISTSIKSQFVCSFSLYIYIYKKKQILKDKYMELVFKSYLFIYYTCIGLRQVRKPNKAQT